MAPKFSPLPPQVKAFSGGKKSVKAVEKSVKKTSKNDEKTEKKKGQRT